MSANIDPAKLEAFLGLSSVLTDFTAFQLRGTGQAELYFTTVAGIVGEPIMTELLSAFRSVETAAGSDTAALERGMRVAILSDEKLGPVARSLLKLWYIGTWYQLPGGWRERFGGAGEDRTFIPAPSAYVEGLLWTAIGAHPPGAKAPGYGTWTEAPVIPDAERLLGSKAGSR
jgi:hypothetical protein